MNYEHKESEQQRDVVRKNVKPLTEAFPEIDISTIVGDVDVKGALVYDIDAKDAPQGACHPFGGRYIKFEFNTEIDSSKLKAESEIRKELMGVIGQELSCMWTPQMSGDGGKCLVYRIDYEMKGFTNCGNAA